MKRFFQAPWHFAAFYAALLLAAFSWALLDTFVIPRREFLLSQARDTVDKVLETLAPNVAAQSAPVVTATSYQDDNISIEISFIRRDNTTCYVADVRLASPSLLKTAFAEDTFGRNLRQTVSDMAQDKNAVLAINGDYYGSRKSGWCLRNGVLYRQSPSSSETDLLLIDHEGNFSILSDRGMTVEAANGLWQIFSFGPALVDDGQIAVDENDEVERAKVSNPRTAIGQIGSLHYALVVTDGRTEESAGLSLAQLAALMRDVGCHTAYNLDGGGSSTMVFMGEVLNKPTANGNAITEREVSDIVCIGL